MRKNANKKKESLSQEAIRPLGKEAAVLNMIVVRTRSRKMCWSRSEWCSRSKPPMPRMTDGINANNKIIIS